MHTANCRGFSYAFQRTSGFPLRLLLVSAFPFPWDDVIVFHGFYHVIVIFLPHFTNVIVNKVLSFRKFYQSKTAQCPNVPRDTLSYRIHGMNLTFQYFFILMLRKVSF